MSDYGGGVFCFSDASHRRVASADFSRARRAHRNTICTRIASADRAPSSAFDRFRKPNPIPRQAALVRRHRVTHGHARVLVFRRAEFRIALGQFVGDQHQRHAGSLVGGGGGEFGVALQAQVAHAG